MIVFYKKSLIRLFRLVQEIRENPFENSSKVLEIQEILIDRISYIEKRIQQNRKRIKELKRTLSSPTVRLPKHIASENKEDISILHDQIDSYQELLVIFRWVGDAIAFLLINRWDMKALGLAKETPGFISGKKGSRKETEIFRAIFRKSNFLVILNDLTNTVRYGDIIVFKKSFPYQIFEIKSQKRENKRTIRQAEKTEKILNYLQDDFTDFLYGIERPRERVSTQTNAIFYINNLNAVLQKARVQGRHYSQVEDGLFYFSELNPTSENVYNFLHKIIGKIKGDVIIGQVNIYSYFNSAYYPPTLSIFDPEDLYLFCTSDLILGVILDKKTIKKKVQERGFIANFSDQDENIAFYIEQPADDNVQDSSSKIGIGRHLFNRIFTEFMSVEWLIKETVVALENKVTELNQ